MGPMYFYKVKPCSLGVSSRYGIAVYELRDVIQCERSGSDRARRYWNCRRCDGFPQGGLATGVPELNAYGDSLLLYRSSQTF